jgi:hypothetical protein
MGKQEGWKICYLKTSLKEIAWETDTQIGNNNKMAVTETWRDNQKRIQLIQDKTELKSLMTASELQVT